MAFFVLNFTRSGTPRKRDLAGQARAILAAEVSGVPPTAQLRKKVRPGDRVITYAGAPERLFVGDAVVAAGYHRWSEDEAARFPDWLAYDYGITLRDVRVWPRPVPLMSVWPHTIGARTNPQALWIGGIIELSRSDAEAILAAAAGRPNVSPVGQARPGAALLGRSGLPRSRGSAGGPLGTGDRQGSPMPAAVRIGERSSAAGAVHEGLALPEAIAHADWGTAEIKRMVATAVLGPSGVYVAHRARMVGSIGGLSERMGVAGAPRTLLLWFDFPIGVPRAYAARAGIENFALWLRELRVVAARVVRGRAVVHGRGRHHRGVNRAAVLSTQRR